MPGFFIFSPGKKLRKALAGLLALVFAVNWPLAASGVTPDSPEVKAMVEKGLKFLEGADDERLGAKCLVGLCFYKAGKAATHPKIVGAINACQSSAGMLGGDGSAVDNYSVGLALVFLLEIDPERHRSLASRYLQEMLRRQRNPGGWGYPATPTGDTSQTQYPTLGLWLAINNGMDVPMDAVQRDCGW